MVMVDNLVAPDLAGKTVNVAHSDGFDETETQVDESFSAVTFGSDGKAEVAATMKAELIAAYPNIQAI